VYCHDFGSILNFIEYVFGSSGAPLGNVPQLGGAPPYPYADALVLDGPNSPFCNKTECPYALSDFFDFKDYATHPRPYSPINAPIPQSCFLNPKSCMSTFQVQNPDDDADE
jgi:hypothetical protein